MIRHLEVAMSLRFVPVLAVLALLVAAPAAAQFNSSIQGVVTDPSSS